MRGQGTNIQTAIQSANSGPSTNYQIHTLSDNPFACAPRINNIRQIQPKPVEPTQSVMEIAIYLNLSKRHLLHQVNRLIEKDQKYSEEGQAITQNERAMMQP